MNVYEPMMYLPRAANDEPRDDRVLLVGIFLHGNVAAAGAVVVVIDPADSIQAYMKRRWTMDKI